MKQEKLYIDLVVEHPNLLPTYSDDGASGCDLKSKSDDVIIVAPGEYKTIWTGVKIELPYGIEAQIRSRSGLAAKYGISVLNSPGTIDASYRGEIGVILINHGKENFIVNQYDRIAQLVISTCFRCKFYMTDRLTESNRGEGGLGSTGVS